MLEKQLSSCGGSAEESSDNTTPNTTSDGNTLSVSQRKIHETYKQPTVITKTFQSITQTFKFPTEILVPFSDRTLELYEFIGREDLVSLEKVRCLNISVFVSRKTLMSPHKRS